MIQELYDRLPFGKKKEFCRKLAEEFDLSEKYILHRWFYHRYGVPNKYYKRTLELLENELESD